MAALKLVSALILCILVTAPPLNLAITCDQVKTALAPCTEYTVSAESRPPEACCSGIGSVSNAANTTANRQTVCNCLKQSDGGLIDQSSSLHFDCGINERFPIAFIDCSEVN